MPLRFIKIEQKPNKQVIALLEANVIGTPGKSMVYKHKNITQKIANIQDPYFANLAIRDRLYGTICLSRRNVYSLGKQHQAFYLRYFTFRESIRATNPNEKSSNSSSGIRIDIAMLMNGEGLAYDEDLVLYAYVDKDNIRSRRLIDEFGFSQMGAFNVIPFSRFYPKINSAFEQLKPIDFDEMRSTLQDYYNEEQLVNEASLQPNENYFVFREKNEIVCGVKAITDGWEIMELPGPTGKIMMHVIPNLPIIGKLFNPNYNFVFLESIYCKDGYHEKLGLLLESVLAYHQIYSGTICLDPKSRIYAEIKKINLGFTHKIMGETKIDLVLKSKNMEQFQSDAPFFVSGHDVL